MVRKIALFGMIILSIFITSGLAQTLDGSPYTPGKDADIDLYLVSWKDSEPYHTHGTLIEQNILTRGDPLHPSEKGAVLKYINRFTHATLTAGTATEPTTLKREQEVIYILSGKGIITWRKKTAGLYSGICSLVPADCEFTISSTGSEPLT
ncbi:MAG: hypothetical protein JXB48_12860, partial [Candidatus Latescibacteria bacterium]|nr:hypothetical protein [Candidatus Latescibacterota bacterium]